ncbi:hypothetical protein Dimus_003503, partial [Dionaea muscipula]
MKVEKDEANIKAHQLLGRLKDLEDARMEAITIADAEWVRVEVLQKAVEEMENRRRKLENLLPHQLEFLMRMTIREFVGSGDLVKM